MGANQHIKEGMHGVHTLPNGQRSYSDSERAALAGVSLRYQKQADAVMDYGDADWALVPHPS